MICDWGFGAAAVQQALHTAVACEPLARCQREPSKRTGCIIIEVCFDFERVRVTEYVFKLAISAVKSHVEHFNYTNHDTDCFPLLLIILTFMKIILEAS